MEHFKQVSEDGNFVLLHGPPFVGKTTHFLTTLRDDCYTRVCPEELLKANPSMSLRQLIYQHIIHPIIAGQKIVVDDCTQTSAIRKSYTNLVISKVPGTKCLCLVLFPQHGLQQLQWQKEFLIARTFAAKDWDLVRTILSVDIQCWNDKCDEDTEDDADFKKIPIPTQLHLVSSFQLMPCLLFDWPCPVDENLRELLRHWHRLNPIGRFIAVVDLSAKTQGLQESDFSSYCKELDQLTSTLDFPIYLYWANDTGDSRYYSVVLAFLVQRHQVDLLSPMARALNNKELVRLEAMPAVFSSLLQQMQIVRSSDTGSNRQLDCEFSSAVLPLYHDAPTFTVAFEGRRAMYLSFANMDILNRYQQCLADACRTEISGNEGNNRPVEGSLTQASTNSDVTQSTQIYEVVTGESPQKRSPTSLPYWMKRKWSMAESRFRGRKRNCRMSIRNPTTLYIMTEDELLQTAQLILNEAEASRVKVESSLNKCTNATSASHTSSHSEEKERNVVDSFAQKTNELLEPLKRSTDQSEMSTEMPLLSPHSSRPIEPSLRINRNSPGRTKDKHDTSTTEKHKTVFNQLSSDNNMDVESFIATLF